VATTKKLSNSLKLYTLPICISRPACHLLFFLEHVKQVSWAYRL